ncbi:hypothetical protein AKJ16_DCAP19949 [Drosera capensis]
MLVKFKDVVQKAPDIAWACAPMHQKLEFTLWCHIYLFVKLFLQHLKLDARVRKTELASSVTLLGILYHDVAAALQDVIWGKEIGGSQNPSSLVSYLCGVFALPRFIGRRRTRDLTTAVPYLCGVFALPRFIGRRRTRDLIARLHDKMSMDNRDLVELVLESI